VAIKSEADNSFYDGDDFNGKNRIDNEERFKCVQVLYEAGLRNEVPSFHVIQWASVSQLKWFVERFEGFQDFQEMAEDYLKSCSIVDWRMLEYLFEQGANLTGSLIHHAGFIDNNLEILNYLLEKFGKVKFVRKAADALPIIASSFARLVATSSTTDRRPPSRKRRPRVNNMMRLIDWFLDLSTEFIRSTLLELREVDHPCVKQHVAHLKEKYLV